MYCMGMGVKPKQVLVLVANGPEEGVCGRGHSGADDDPGLVGEERVPCHAKVAVSHRNLNDARAPRRLLVCVLHDKHFHSRPHRN